MAVNLSPVFQDAQFTSSGALLNGGFIYSYVAGSSTPLTTYTDNTGVTPQANPITLNARGEVASPIWLTSGLSYKLRLFDASNNFIREFDNVKGVNDTTLTIDQWVSPGLTPIYVSATQFTLAGDQTSAFHVGRRVKYTVTAGTGYGRISATAFAALTTVTIVNDAGSALDSGLSAVQIGLITTDNTSFPVLKDSDFKLSGSSDKTKLVALEVDTNVTTGTTRTLTIPDKNLTIAGTIDITSVQGFRLTLTTALPVTTADVTGAVTIFCTPYKGTAIALYDGTNWNIRTSAEFSLALGTLTSGKPYDVFCYDNAGVPTLEFLVWTNDTTRATALVYQDGILVKSGATTRRYMGTFYTTATTTTEDSASKRYLWNYYHRVNKNMKNTIETTDSWTYTTGAYRQANANTANQLNYVVGVAEDFVTTTVNGSSSNSGALNTVSTAVSVGVDSTSVASGNQGPQANLGAGVKSSVFSSYTGIPGVGRHFLAWLEYSEAVGTTTWYGDNAAPTLYQSGIQGSLLV